jgi:hypothetical protein
MSAKGWLARARTQPYTSIGIRRVPCVRCGAPAVHQWQVCADLNRYRALCLDCDIALNAYVLTWANDPDAEKKVTAYAEKQRTIESMK